MDIKKIPNRYRPVPFWSWNEKLDRSETERQVQILHAGGLGGFFMHARGGLQTPFMGQEWFDNIEAATRKAEELGMYAWAYDENGWPSGFGDGRVNGRGEAYQQKYLRMGEVPENGRLIARVDGLCFYYEVNPFYVDTLDPMVTRAFLQEIYEPYYQKMGNRLEGFFTDEPQISRNGIPWSFVLEDAYRSRYGQELIPHLPELFLPRGNYKTTRVRFWKMITDLFSAGYVRQIYEWCDARGLKLTGHMVLEETFAWQITSNGAVMPHYEYLHIPGMDCLCREVIHDLTPFQLGSAAQQLGKKQVLAEDFAMCGHNVSFDELRRILGHQMVHGVNLLCQHLAGYSLRGIRKRDFPPALFYQQPWWDKYSRFTEAVSRVGMILAEGSCSCDTLLMHPQTTAWTLFDNDKNEGLEPFYQRFKAVVNGFDRMHIPFHLGDETILERHGRVEGRQLIVGKMAYTTVVIPEHSVFLENTENLLRQFRENGGRIVSPEDMKPRREIVDNPNVLYTSRQLDGVHYYFFQNDSEEFQQARIGRGAWIIDQATGEKQPFAGEYTFAPCENLLVLDDGTARKPARVQVRRPLDLTGTWKITEAEPNVLLLDKCDYWFDGVLQEKNGFVLNIQNRALALERPVKIRQEYHVSAETVPEELCLVCETPEIFEICVNGKPVNRQDLGWFRDSAFRKLDISGLLHTGDNVISFETEFTQAPSVYENLRKARIFESEKNKLSYGMEIDACCLIGSFGVKTPGAFTALDREACRYHGEFVLTDMPESVTLENLEQQGFPFFAGSLTVEKTLELADDQYEIALRRKGISCVDVGLNGRDAGAILFRSDRIDGENLLHSGKNTVTLRLCNNLRNMLGPHHLEMGECYAVHPGVFYKEKCVWANPPAGFWNEDYCFVETSVEAEKETKPSF